MRKIQKRKKRKNRVGKVCVSCMVMTLILVLSVQMIRLYGKNETYRQQQEELQAELDEENRRAEDLQEQEEYVGSDQYIEDTARSKLGMVYEDEIIYRED